MGLKPRKSSGRRAAFCCSSNCHKDCAAVQCVRALRSLSCHRKRCTVRGNIEGGTRQVAQLSQRDRAAGWVSYGQKWKTGTGRQYLRTILVYIQPLRRIWPAKYQNPRKKLQIRDITPFKVIQVGTSRKPVCDFLLVINGN